MYSHSKDNVVKKSQLVSGCRFSVCKWDNDYDCAQENAKQAMNEIHESILIPPPQRLAERTQFQFLARLTEIGFDYGWIVEIDHVESDC